ncbi:MAG: hypothetical protein KAZ71_06170 [Bacteroidia bacterium]|nr:hypothetical protein [Bacteroidia bacterium]
MNESSLIYNWIVEQFQSNELVNTISIVPTAVIDTNKENIYPLVNIDLIDIETESDYLTYNFNITVIQQRDIKPIKIDSKLMTNTNYIDNINETVSIANRFINVIEKQNNDSNIELQSLSRLKVLKEWGTGICDGVRFDISLSIPNIGLSC